MTNNALRQSEIKERIPAWLYPETIRKIDDMVKTRGFKSRSDFLEEAANFYAGYLQTQNSTAFLSSVLIDVMKGIVDNSAQRINTSLFRMAVELSMLAHAVAYTTEPSEDDLKTLRATCVKAVKNLHAPISFAEANRIQNGER